MPNDDLDQTLNPEDFEDDFEDDEDGNSETDDETEKDSNSETETDDDAKSKEDDEEKQKRINAKNAERRRKKQAKEKERLENEQKIRDKAKLEGELSMMKVNPYTHEKIEDEEDLKIYKIQKQIDDEDGDPINDLPKKLAQINRKLAKEKEEKDRADSAEQEKINKEISDFKKARPDIDTTKLAKDTNFMEYGEGKFGRWTFEEIYEGYQAKVAKQKKAKEDAEENDAIKESAKKQTKIPNPTGEGTQATKKISDMSDEEFIKYWNKKYN